MLNIKILILFFLICPFARGQFIIDSYKYVVPCVNEYAEQNVVNDCDEANDISGITNPTGSMTLSASTSFPDTGTYSLRALHVGTVDDAERVEWTFTAVVGRTYQIEMRVYRDTGSNNWWLTLDSGNGWVASASNRTSVLDGYETLLVTGEADTTSPEIWWSGSTGADVGDDSYISWIIVTDITP